MGNPSESLADAQKALELDPSYTKAYSRLGHAYFSLEQFEESVEAYQKALDADPTNSTLRASLAAAKDKVQSVSKSIPTDGAQGMPDLGGIGGMDLGSMMNNPGFMDMGNNLYT